MTQQPFSNDWCIRGEAEQVSWRALVHEAFPTNAHAAWEVTLPADQTISLVAGVRAVLQF